MTNRMPSWMWWSKPRPCAAADQPDAVAADDVEELGLALAKPAFRLRGIVTAQVGWRVQQHDPVGLGRRGERLVQVRERLDARARRVRRRRVTEVAGVPGGAVDGYEARGPVSEVEVPWSVHGWPGRRRNGIFKIVVADQAHVRDLQPRRQLEVVLVARDRAGTGEVTEVRE